MTLQLKRPTFTPVPEKPPGFAILAQSSARLAGEREWQEFGLADRLHAQPVLGRLVREGKAILRIHSEPTIKCSEKARISGMDLECVIKTLCCCDAYDPEGPAILVSASSGTKIDLARVSSQALDYASLRLAPRILPGMCEGTCTPLASREGLRNVSLLLLEDPDRGPGRLGDRHVDVSIGGTDELSRHLSITVSYRDLVQALIGEHGDKVRLFCDSPAEGRTSGRVTEQLKAAQPNPRRPKRVGPRLKAIRRLGSLAREGLDSSRIQKELEALHLSDANEAVRKEAGHVLARIRGLD